MTLCPNTAELRYQLLGNLLRDGAVLLASLKCKSYDASAMTGRAYACKFSKPASLH